MRSVLIRIRKSISGLRDLPWRSVLKTALFSSFALYIISYFAAQNLKTRYVAQESIIMRDRNGAEIMVRPNAKGHYARFSATIPADYARMLVAKEDRFYYFHPGANPLSILRSAVSRLLTGRFEGASTITQQVAKLVLGNENERTWANKFKEALFALALELHASKAEILAMHANLAYFGNQAQGIEEASRYFFARTPEALERDDNARLLAAESRPSLRAPAAMGYARKNTAAFELEPVAALCKASCTLTADAELTNKLREVLRNRLRTPEFASVENAALVVIRTPRDGSANELLAIVGSAEPQSTTHGSQINMAVSPRPVGSTAKPFIYLKAFEAGARPYTQVDDEEYRYAIGTGFSFYPKNYDGKFRGTVTLREALANSLNVPSVKVLEFVGIDQMAEFFEKSLGFRPLQPLQTYGLGIALGALEMDLLTLTNYFTIFPNDGILRPLIAQTSPEGFFMTPPMAKAIEGPIRVASPAHVALVRSILTDRESGVEQFGMKSALNLPAHAYGVKTGTSRDYHDSWTIGFTPDFTVGVWIGNSDNTPMQKISGQMGAGSIWHEAMELLLASPYATGAAFPKDSLERMEVDGTLEYGLAGDDILKTRSLLRDPRLILSPHNGDTFLLESATTIPFRAREEVSWYVNNNVVGNGAEITWKPFGPGTYAVAAETVAGRREEETIMVAAEE